MTTNNQVTLIQNLAIDTKISFDDVVNVFVARYEDELHQRRGNIQQQIKALQANQKILAKHISHAVDTNLRGMFVSLANGHGIEVDFTWVLGDELVLPEGKDSVDVTVTSTFRLPKGVQAPNYQGKLTVLERELVVRVTPGDKLVREWNELQTAASAEKQKLLQINTDLQGVDRKTRQIKGLIAERRLAEAGMQALLDSPEIQSILATPALVIETK